MFVHCRFSPLTYLFICLHTQIFHMKPVKVVSKQQTEHFSFVLRTLFSIRMEHKCRQAVIAMENLTTVLSYLVCAKQL